MLHLTKVAFGCESVDYLAERLRAHEGAGAMRLNTRYLPKRHAEVVGGSLYWIWKHKLVGRSEIVRFDEAPGGRHDIVLAPRLILTQARPKRAHQGWRYLDADQAPPDLMAGDALGDELPRALIGELAALGLI